VPDRTDSRERLLFGRSLIRRAVLGAFFVRPQVEGHARALAKDLGYRPQAVGRELDRLERAGILTSRRIGRLRLYQVADTVQSRLVEQLHSRTAGISAQLARALAPLAEVERAFIFGSHAAGSDTPDSDIDVFVVTHGPHRDVIRVLMEAERRLEREINATIHSPEEIEQLRRDHSSFIHSVETGPREDLDIATPRRSLSSE